MNVLNYLFYEHCTALHYTVVYVQFYYWTEIGKRRDHLGGIDPLTKQCTSGMTA